MNPAWQVRPLQHTDWPAYRALRLAALVAHPEAFGSSWEEESQFDEATWQQRVTPLPPNFACGGFAGSELAGMASLLVQPKLKERHRGLVVGVYVAPAQRGSGLARGLLEAVIDHARGSGLLVLELAVALRNAPARRLYLDLGFRPYGIARRALRLGDDFVDEELMSLDID